MMSSAWMLAVLFLPLFPFSALFVLVIGKSRYIWLRNALDAEQATRWGIPP